MVVSVVVVVVIVAVIVVAELVVGIVAGRHEAANRASEMALWHARVSASLFARHCFR